METSLSFSSFRDLLDKWDNFVKMEKTEEILDDDSICFYFTMGGSVYGGSEESRLIFAKCKDPKDEDKKVMKDAMFSAVDLTKTQQGNKSERMFGFKDVPKIKIIDRSELEKILKK